MKIVYQYFTFFKLIFLTSSGLYLTRRRPGGRPRQTWLRTVENDLKQQNLGLWSARHRSYDRELWRGNGNAPAGARYMMMMMMMRLVVVVVAVA